MKRMTGIYVITSLHNKFVYVGSAADITDRWKRHTRLLKRGRHHSIRLQNAWNKYGSANFVLSVLELTNLETLIDREQYWIDALNAAGEKGYNVLPLAKNSTGLKHRPESIKKISEASKGKKISDAQRAAVSAAVKGREIGPEEMANRKASWTTERRKRRSEISAAIVLSEEARAKISEKHKGRVFSAEWKAKLSAAAKGRVFSEDVRAKMSAATKRRKPISEETRARMAHARAEYWQRKRQAEQTQ